MTAGQRIFEEGRQQALEEGRQQAVEQGHQQGLQSMLLRLARDRFGDAVDAQVEQRISTASLEQILAWTPRVLSAATLADLFSA